MMAALEQLQLACQTLLFSTHSHLIGFAHLEVEDANSLAYVLNDKERAMLALYDKFTAISLEKSELEASDQSKKDSSPDTTNLEKDLIQARANLQLKETVVEATLVAQPILAAIHQEQNTPVKERDLLPLLQRRDTLSLTHANLAHTLAETLRSLTAVERECAGVQAENRQLAQRVLEAARRRDRKGGEAEGEAEAKRKVREAKREVDVVRGVAQAVVVGSGADWAREEGARAVVMMCGDE